jgi:hypothetical protein
MIGLGSRGLRSWLLLVLLGVVIHFSAVSEPVAARHLEGTEHGFLELRSDTGQAIAEGDLIQVVRGDRVTSHLLFHFKDGSIDDETSVFTQRGRFRLVSDHHIQKGPFFSQSIDMSIDVPKGQVIVRSIGKDGKEDVSTERMSLPPDLYNGLVNSILKNLSPDQPETKVSMIVATPKARLVKLAISPLGSERFSLAGMPREAWTYEIKIELGGLAGVIAPAIGKQPPPIKLWIAGGEVPVFLREEGPLFMGSPIVTMELTSPSWPKASVADTGK